MTININFKIKLEEATIDGEELENKDIIPLKIMEEWFELYYSDEEFEGENVDVNIDLIL